MTYQIHYSDDFTADIYAHIDYLSSEGVAFHVMDTWYGRLYKLIDHLDQWPYRFPVDREQSEATGRETRKMNFGDYLVFYQVDDDRRRVDVVAFMHGARRRETQ